MKPVLFFLLLMSAPCFGQSRYTQKLYHFIEKKAGEKDTMVTHFIFIELPKDSACIWQTAVIDSSIYTIHSTQVETLPLELGIQAKNQKKAVITPKAGNTLWRLELDLEQQSSSAFHDTTKPVVLKGSFKGRKISCTVSGAIELEPM